MAAGHEANVSMLVRAPAAAAFEAFVDPRRITRFWLRRSSGRLEPGRTLAWEFRVPGAHETTRVDEVRAGELLRLRWSDGIAVRIAFEARSRSSCTVRVAVGRFRSAARAVDAAEGFTIVLCDLKVWLETGTSPGLVRDKARLIAAAAGG
jgi:uncharacterized protein YndB with AHSA1/START domain